MSDKSVREGGLPGDAVELHPRFKAEEEVAVSYGGEMGIKTAKGDPAENPFKPPKDFLSESGYHASEFDIRGGSIEKSGKVVNPDSISH